MTALQGQPKPELSDARLARAVLLLLLAIYTATFSGPPAGPDGEVSFQTTSSLWREGSLALGGTPEAQGLIEFSLVQPPGGFSVRPGAGPGEGQFYGWFGVGQALVGLPFYALGRLGAVMAPSVQAAHESHTRFGVARSEYFEHLLVGWRNPLLTALTAFLIVQMTLLLGASRPVAFVSGLGYGLATFAWPQARAALSDVQGTFFVTWALYLLMLMAARPTSLRSLLLGLALAMAFLTRVALLPAVLVLDGALLLLLMSRSSIHPVGDQGDEPSDLSTGQLLLAWATPQVIALFLWLLLNHLRFGDALDSGYSEALAGGLFGGNPARALLGLTLSPGKGLLWMAPALVMLLPALSWVRRERQQRFACLVGVLVIAITLPILLLGGWHGAWTFGPRYLLPALPALWVVASLGFQRSDIDLRPRPVALALLGVGLLIQLPAVLVDTTTYHDLAVRAAREHLEVPVEGTSSDRAAREFEAIQFDWGFAAPWSHWRILRRRLALGREGAQVSESFPVAEIFCLESDLVLRPSQPREMGFSHLAWVDLSRRLGGSIWPPVALVALLALLGLISAVGALQP